MTQYTFGGGADDFTYATATVGTSLLMGPLSANVTFWSAQTGGTQYTVTLNGVNVSAVTTVNGQLPTFSGPSGIYQMWADAGAGRVIINAHDYIATFSSPGDAAIAALVPGPSATATALANSFYLQTRAQTLYGYASLASTVGPLGLPKWKQKLALSLLGQSPARVLCLGDSTTAGVSADSYTTATGTTWQDTANAYPRQLVSRLNALGVPAAMGMTLPGSAGGVDQHWSFTGGSLFTASGVGIGGAQGVIMSHVSDSWTVTPGVAADTYKIYYWTVSGGGTFSAQATGGTLASVSTASGTQTVATQTITAGSVSAANAVSLICTTAGAGCVIFAVEFWDSTNPNKVRVLPAGCPGQDSSAFATGAATATYGSRAVTKAIAPDLTIGSLGINDNYHGLSLATTQANFTALATDAQLSGDMLWLSAIPPSTGNSFGITVSSINAWLLSLGGAYVDLQTRYGTNMFATGLQTTDKIHPNAMGYRDIAMCVANALLR